MEGTMSHQLHEFMTGQKPKAISDIDRRCFWLLFWPLLFLTAFLSVIAWGIPEEDQLARQERLLKNAVIVYVEAAAPAER
jgi:hypothetical protein